MKKKKNAFPLVLGQRGFPVSPLPQYEDIFSTQYAVRLWLLLLLHDE